MERRKKLSKRTVKLIVFASVAVLVCLSLIITNVFIPLKYLSAYIIFNKDETPNGVMRVRFLDVDAGDCAIVELPDGKTLLVDGGNGAYSSQLSILKVLNGSGIGKIDYCVCTSVKSEHCGGLAEIVKLKGVSRVFMPYCTDKGITREFSDFCSEVSAYGASVSYCEYGEGLSDELYGFCFLSPGIHDEDPFYQMMNASPTTHNINNASAILWLEYAGTGFLFLSDAGYEAQSALAKSIDIDADYVRPGGDMSDINNLVVKVAEHGSASSFCSELIDRFATGKAVAAVISVGRNARGYPSADTVAEFGMYAPENVYRTDYDGTVSVTVKPGMCRVSKEIK